MINVCWRNNLVLLAKQLSSVQRLSGGRLTAGLGMGDWPADYEAGGVPLAGRGALFDASVALERSVEAVATPGGTIRKPIYASWVGAASTSPTHRATSPLCGRTNSTAAA